MKKLTIIRAAAGKALSVHQSDAAPKKGCSLKMLQSSKSSADDVDGGGGGELDTKHEIRASYSTAPHQLRIMSIQYSLCSSSRETWNPIPRFFACNNDECKELARRARTNGSAVYLRLYTPVYPPVQRKSNSACVHSAHTGSDDATPVEQKETVP